MGLHLKLKECQLALLELSAAVATPNSVWVPQHVRYSMGGLGPTPYIEYMRKKQRWEHKQLLRRIAYLRRHNYFERVKEGNERLYRLTSKGKYELLRLELALQLAHARRQKWDKKFYLVIFDIPEEKKKYRDVFRKLLKKHGFKMLQLSVWITKYNPQPAFDKLLNYLGLTQYFEIMELHCTQCSTKLVHKIR